MVRKFFYFWGKVVGVIAAILIILALLPPYPPNMLVGDTEYCEHFVSDQVSVRLKFTPYSTDPDVDPNRRNADPAFAHDLMTNWHIVIPYVDYEVTHDGGESWEHFWRFDNDENEYPWCAAFSALDENNFWIWTRNWIVITHNAGEAWIIQDVNEAWITGVDLAIEAVAFDTPESGRISFIQWRNNPHAALLTTDGGRTWIPDPNWIWPQAAQTEIP